MKDFAIGDLNNSLYSNLSPMAKSFITFQPIPKFLRKMTDSSGQGGKFFKRFYSLVVLLLLRPILFFKYLVEKVLK